jgi:putative ABC transport system ATP-binding protein
MKTSPSIIDLVGVSKQYQSGGKPFFALKNISLTISVDDYTAIIGPSGSGKSTLMHIMGLLDNPSRGKVIFNGQDVSQLSETQLARIRNKGVGFIFQQFNLLQRASALDNVALPLVYSNLPPRTRFKKAKAMLIKVGLADKLDNHPNQLSGGEQQRVAIARALVNDPQIIFADEPTGNLDSKTGQGILKLFQELNQKDKRTLVVVSHDSRIARQAKKTIKIKDGRIL